MDTTPLDSPLYLKLTTHQDIAALKLALAVFSSLGVGQLEALYWSMVKPGLIPINREQLEITEIGSVRLKAVGDKIQDLKAVLGFPADGCLAVTHPDVADVIRTAYDLESQLAAISPRPSGRETKAVAGPTNRSQGSA